MTIQNYFEGSLNKLICDYGLMGSNLQKLAAVTTAISSSIDVMLSVNTYYIRF